MGRSRAVSNRLGDLACVAEQALEQDHNMHNPSLGHTSRAGKAMATDEHPAALKTRRASALVEPAKNERSYAFRDPFDSFAFDTLTIARLTGSSTTGDDDAEDRKNERKGAEYEILPPPL
jgi:hypothetical protein